MRLLTTTVVGLLVALLIGGSYMWGLNARRHTCAAPCTVSFAHRHMAEDNFGIDYHNQVVDVFWSAPAESRD